MGSGKGYSRFLSNRVNRSIESAARGLNTRYPILSPVTSRVAMSAKKKAGDMIGAVGEYVENILMVHPESMSVVQTSGEPVKDKAIGSRKTAVDYQGPVKSRTFTENYVMGESTSKALQNAAKQNGVKTICLFDSTNDVNFKDPTKPHREYLELVTGFNQKLIFQHKRFSINWSDIYENIYKIGFNTTASTNPDNQIRTVDYRIYGGALSLNNKLRFRNNMSTTSCKLKVHIVAAKTVADSRTLAYNAPVAAIGYLPTAANDTSQGMDTNKIITATTAYPRPNYAPGGTWTSNLDYGEGFYALLTPSASVTDSEYFNSRFKIVKTFKKTLDVGDELLLNIKSTFGSGLRLDRVLAMKQELAGFVATDPQDWVFPYFVVAELLGPSVTAETTAAGNYEDKFIGTAPCSVNFEAKQYFTYALESNSGVPTTSLSALTEADFSNRIGQPLVRYFVKDEVVSLTPFNVSYWNSTQSASPTIKIKSATTANIADVKTIL